MKCSSISSVVFGVLLLLGPAAAGLLGGDGSLTPEIAGEIRAAFRMDPHTRAIYNAITNNNTSQLALNRDILRQHNELFSHKIKTKGITAQKSSGRCWLFAGLNVMRPAVIEKYKLENFEFSQNYLAFWDKMEKANCYLEYMIELGKRDPLDRELEKLISNPFSDGGWWEYVVALVDKYGVVPKDVMPETHSSGNTGSMNAVIRRKLKADTLKLRKLCSEGKPLEEIRAAKKRMLAEVYRMLVMNLGQPPTEFRWRYEDKDSKLSEIRTYTPRSFYKEWVDVDLGQYVNICNDPTQEYDKHYRLARLRNVYEREDVHYANVEIAVLKELAMKSVLDDQPVWFAADVGQDQDRKHGIMAVGLYDYGPIYGADTKMTKAERLLYREGTANHAMVFVGVDVENGKPVKWLVENSWGKEAGHEGYWTLYDSWFDEHVYGVIVKKAYVPNHVLNIYKQDPVVLPLWHPMATLFAD